MKLHVLDVVVHHADAGVVAVVALRDFEVHSRQGVAGDRLAVGGHLVHAQFEFRELRLPEDGELNPLQVLPQERQLHIVVGERAEHVVQQQRLVEGGGDFGHEDRVVGGGKRLDLVRQVALHRVTEAAGQRAHIVELAVVVHQDVRVDVVGRALRIGT